MREIKFRVWDTEERKMRHNVGVQGNCVFANMEGTLLLSTEHNPVMQYTGLKDKNGKEIYDGDLIHLPAWNPNIVEIVFNRGAFCFRFASSDAFYHDVKYVEDGEIIGNIYENPELLK